jgi:hypothetical protein
MRLDIDDFSVFDNFLYIHFNVHEDQVGALAHQNLTSVGQPLLDGVREVLARWAADSPFIASLDLQGRVRLLDSDHAAGSNADSDLPDRPVAALGAAYLGRG